MWKRALELFHRRRLEEDLDQEVNLHLVMLEEEFRRRGMSAQSAHAAARREFGGVMQTKEAYRDQRGLPWLENLAKDVRYALRGLRSSPGFTAAAVLSLALGIGANTAIFSLFHALLLRMLPVAHPEELVLLHVGSGGAGFASSDFYSQLAKRTDLFNGVLARNAGGRVTFQREGGRPESASNEQVSGNYFTVLGINPAVGRFFTEQESATADGKQLVVLSYGLWQNRFGGDPKIVGQQLNMLGKPFTVIGVAPPGFYGVAVESRTELWRPKITLAARNVSWLYLVARRRPDISAPQLQSALDVVMRQYQASVWGSFPNSAFKRKALEERIEVRDAGIGLSFLREQFAEPLRVLMAAVLLVLLATCTNVAHLLLARGAARRKETAVRLALGAGRVRLVRQALTESFLLAALGTIPGVALAIWGERCIMLFVPAARAGALDVSPDSAVMIFTGAIAFLSALLFGLAPAIRSTAIDPVASLRAGGGGVSRPGLRRSLVVLQITFSVVLVTLAGLFSHSLQELRAVDIGFRNQQILTFWLDFPRAWKDSQIETARDRFIAEVTAIPGVSSASYGSPDLFQGRSWGASVNVPGSDRTVSEPGKAFRLAVGPRYLETLGTAPLLGREFNRNDTPAAQKTVMVNEAFVREFLGGAKSPLGRVLSLAGDDPKDRAPRVIVGVVHDIAHTGVREKADPTIYLPDGQIENPFGAPSFILRAALPPSVIVPALRRTLDNIGPDMWRTDAKTVRQRIDESIYPDRMLAVLSGFFGVLALLLAAIGLYGVVAYGTARRAGEIGIRMALGAERMDVLFMVLRDALLLVAVGLAVGLPCALAAGRAVSSVLFGIKPGDPAALVATACALIAVGLAAAFVPARRAASMDPMRALRHE